MARGGRGEVATIALLLAMSLAAGGADRGELTLEQANARWSGARCSLRYPIPIKKKVASNGESRSPIFQLPSGKGEKRLALVFTVTDRRALERVLIADEIPAGTELVSLGWTLSRPQAKEGLGLSLRFVEAPAELRVGFIPAFGSADSLRLEQLEQVERYTRLETFVCAPADERLVDVGPSGAAPAAPVVVAPRPAAPVAVEPPRSVAPTPAFALAMHAVAVRPAQVAAGGTVELVLTYELTGGAPTTGVEVRERREILRGERSLRALEATLARGPGVHASAQSLRLPASLEPGLYALRGTVEVAGREANGTALFEVVPP